MFLAVSMIYVKNQSEVNRKIHWSTMTFEQIPKMLKLLYKFHLFL